MVNGNYDYEGRISNVFNFLDEWKRNINETLIISFKEEPWYLNHHYKYLTEGGKKTVEIHAAALKCQMVPCWSVWDDNYYMSVGADKITSEELKSIKWNSQYAKDLNEVLNGHKIEQIKWHHRQRHPKILFQVHEADESKRPPLANYDIKLSDKKI